MAKTFDITPHEGPRVETPFRRIVTPIPHPDSLPTLERLQRCEPVAMQGQPPIVWDRAEGVQVWDRHGNMWLDWSSGVLVTNAGHAAPAIRAALIDQVESGLLHNYCFPSEERAELAEALARLAPGGPDGWKAFLLTTGAETTENAIKLARSWGLRSNGSARLERCKDSHRSAPTPDQRKGDRRKIGIVTFSNAFHGRTLGSQQIGGFAGQRDWIVNLDPDIHHVPFPDGFFTEDTRFELFLETLEAGGVTPDRVAGVISETYQGAGPYFMPVPYAQALAEWCRKHDALLIFDEVQAGFGRTGTLWGFEHYGVVPDLICCGKGITSSLPLGAVLGRAEILDQFPPGSMTSTHTGNPLCCRAALASLQTLFDDGLIENARALESPLLAGLEAIRARHPDAVGTVCCRGLVAGLILVRPGTKEPHADLAHAVVERAYRKGLLLFAPVGVGGGCVKIAPPLCLTEAALQDGLLALSEAFDEAAAERRE